MIPGTRVSIALSGDAAGAAKKSESGEITPPEVIPTTWQVAQRAPVTRATLRELLSRPHLTYDDIEAADAVSSRVPAWLRELVQIRVKYAGYIRRQERDIERFKRLERVRIPEEIWECPLPGLSLEADEKLKAMKPRSLGQAGRIPGITPADVSVLHLHLNRFDRVGDNSADSREGVNTDDGKRGKDRRPA